MLPLAFGFGSPADIAIILVVALIIFGPKKLPEVGKQLGQALREMKLPARCIRFIPKSSRSTSPLCRRRTNTAIRIREQAAQRWKRP